MKSIVVIRILFLFSAVQADLILENAKKYGYSVKIHSTITTDGYNITLHQFPKENSNASVLLVHGLVGCGSIWTYHRESLLFLLADAGYDVWVYSARGTTLSRGHTKLNENDEAYWNYSLHELGVFDLSATIDYVLENNLNKSLSLIGFSQGTTTSLILLSTLPEYNKKLKSLYLLAPVVFVNKANAEFMDTFVHSYIHKLDFSRLQHSFIIQTICRFSSICAKTIIGEPNDHFKAVSSIFWPKNMFF